MPKAKEAVKEPTKEEKKSKFNNEKFNSQIRFLEKVLKVE